ncbi:MAG: hypothetical protein MI919_06105, partial [Holophagales bacterium]|nr:hypothetical protein [Holophagales bacterium]
MPTRPLSPSSPTPSHDSPETVPRDREAAPPADETGLRSSSAIRWLLFVGALVVSVSTVRLVAAGWGTLPAAVQFLVLSAGSLGVYALGDLARHRLRLPVAGSALLALFAALPPVLAWGAAHRQVLQEPLGTVAVYGGLAFQLVAVRRLLVRAFDYRGWILPATLGFFLAALPAASSLGLPSIVTAGVLGGALALASRHVNRFFFHRDRKPGLARPLSALP